jgi:hypothetical protein
MAGVLLLCAVAGGLLILRLREGADVPAVADSPPPASASRPSAAPEVVVLEPLPFVEEQSATPPVQKVASPDPPDPVRGAPLRRLPRPPQRRTEALPVVRSPSAPSARQVEAPSAVDVPVAPASSPTANPSPASVAPIEPNDEDFEPNPYRVPMLPSSGL